MNILKNINERLSIVEEGNVKSGEQGILQIMETSPIELPDDYISFLKNISGEGCIDIGFGVDDSHKFICIWSAKEALSKYDDFQEFIDKIWLIGDDVGDTVFFMAKTNMDLGFIKAMQVLSEIMKKKLLIQLLIFW